jgi:hypothetical protein
LPFCTLQAWRTSLREFEIMSLSSAANFSAAPRDLNLWPDLFSDARTKHNNQELYATANTIRLKDLLPKTAGLRPNQRDPEEMN